VLKPVLRTGGALCLSHDANGILSGLRGHIRSPFFFW
jgi:hypothetical protein